MTKISNNIYIVTFIVLFVISTALLLIASTARTPVPAWGGYLDVGIAVIIAIIGFVIFGRGRDNPSYDSGHRAALNIILITLLGMWVLRDAFDFNILLPELAWRVFFFLHIRPRGAALRHPGTVNE
jgi:hypothetical protein